jgi:3-hydroxy acid dehydrogenase/malonic semialdehyde reductase
VNEMGKQSERGRTALVTGAGNGMGRAIALALHEAGYTLVLVDRDADALAAAAANIDGAAAIDLDITDHAAIDSLPGRLQADGVVIDTLINAAGHDPGGTTRFDQGSADDWTSAVETNLIGTMRVTRAFVAGMIERGRGDIVNIGSIAGIRLVPDMTAYNTSKAGLHAFSDQLRADLAATPVRVIEVLPGLTRTDLIRKRYRGDEQRAAEYYARFEMALEPEDIARTVLYALQAPPHMVLAQAVVLPVNRW